MTCVPSLADLSKLLLKRVLREDGAPHDCKEDAIAAVQLAKHLMQHGPTLVLDPPNVKVHLRFLQDMHLQYPCQGALFL